MQMAMGTSQRSTTRYRNELTRDPWYLVFGTNHPVNKAALNAPIGIRISVTMVLAESNRFCPITLSQSALPVIDNIHKVLVMICITAITTTLWCLLSGLLVSEVASQRKATITSVIEMVDVMAATHISPKKTVQVSVGLNICWNTAGKVTNVRSGPSVGLNP